MADIFGLFGVERTAKLNSFDGWNLKMIIVRGLTLLTMMLTCGIAGATAYFILYSFVYQVRFLKRDWRPVLARGVVSFIVWLTLTSGMLLVIFFGFIFGDRLDPPVAIEELKALLLFFLLTVIYGLAGWGLCHWVKGRAVNDVEEQNPSPGVV
ncbi:MAG TPA: hypothetical protein VGO91_16140 [Pyrinomonadaceae bacterium]|jgi:hypothetical protein|nr:hypothetical protein [Pyrinomonadaceae bacterium]